MPSTGLSTLSALTHLSPPQPWEVGMFSVFISQMRGARDKMAKQLCRGPAAGEGGVGG